MNIVDLALEMLFLPLSIGMLGAAFCVWRDRKEALAKLHRHHPHGQAHPGTKLV